MMEDGQLLAILNDIQERLASLEGQDTLPDPPEPKEPYVEPITLPEVSVPSGESSNPYPTPQPPTTPSPSSEISLPSSSPPEISEVKIPEVTLPAGISSQPLPAERSLAPQSLDVGGLPATQSQVGYDSPSLPDLSLPDLSWAPIPEGTPPSIASPEPPSAQVDEGGKYPDAPTSRLPDTAYGDVVETQGPSSPEANTLPPSSTPERFDFTIPEGNLPNSVVGSFPEFQTTDVSYVSPPEASLPGGYDFTLPSPSLPEFGGRELPEGDGPEFSTLEVPSTSSPGASFLETPGPVLAPIPETSALPGLSGIETTFSVPTEFNLPEFRDNLPEASTVPVPHEFAAVPQNAGPAVSSSSSESGTLMQQMRAEFDSLKQSLQTQQMPQMQVDGRSTNPNFATGLYASEGFSAASPSMRYSNLAGITNRMGHGSYFDGMGSSPHWLENQTSIEGL